jgi:hypothetical protein
MGSEKACQIALDCDPRTPLFGDLGRRDSYSKVLLTESPKMYNGKDRYSERPLFPDGVGR